MNGVVTVLALDSYRNWKTWVVPDKLTNAEQHDLEGLVICNRLSDVLQKASFFWHLFYQVAQRHQDQLHCKCNDGKIWCVGEDPSRATQVVFAILEIVRQNLVESIKAKKPALFAVQKFDTKLNPGQWKTVKVLFLPVTPLNEEGISPNTTHRAISTHGTCLEAFPLPTMMEHQHRKFFQPGLKLLLTEELKLSVHEEEELIVLAKYRQIQGNGEPGEQGLQWKSPVYEIDPFYPKQHSNHLGLYDLYREGRFTNFTLCFDGGGEVKVHDSILYLHGGDFFQALFNAPYQENQTREVHLPGCSIEIGKLFVEYLYIGSAAFGKDPDSIDWFALARIADQLGVKSLVDECAKAIELEQKATQQV
jgi:hypothetical protein